MSVFIFVISWYYFYNLLLADNSAEKKEVEVED